MFEFLKRCGDDTSGATAVEYGLIVALIFLAAVVAIQNFGNSTQDMYDRIITAINGVVDF